MLRGSGSWIHRLFREKCLRVRIRRADMWPRICTGDAQNASINKNATLTLDGTPLSGGRIMRINDGSATHRKRPRLMFPRLRCGSGVLPPRRSSSSVRS